MAFGQAAGPPAGARQVQQLTELLAAAGFDTFREARHTFGLTQRQANGRFTVSEAEDLLERLEVGSGAVTDSPHTTGASVPISSAAREKADRKRRQREDETVARMADDILADELTRRGWCCIPPA